MINNNEIRVFTNTHRVNETEIGREFKITVTIPKDIKVNNLKVLFNMEGENPSVVKEMTKEQTTRGNLAYDCYTAVVTLDRIGNYYYFFSFTDNYGHNQGQRRQLYGECGGLARQGPQRRGIQDRHG